MERNSPCCRASVESPNTRDDSAEELLGKPLAQTSGFADPKSPPSSSPLGADLRPPPAASTDQYLLHAYKLLAKGLCGVPELPCMDLIHQPLGCNGRITRFSSSLPSPSSSRDPIVFALDSFVGTEGVSFRRTHPREVWASRPPKTQNSPSAALTFRGWVSSANSYSESSAAEWGESLELQSGAASKSC